jgi:glycosyltransferase involved in cell wall biosynthesis
MNNRKPSLLILSSSFPSSPDDETCGYVREFARRMGLEFDVQVLTFADPKAKAWLADSQGLEAQKEGFQLVRAKSFLPLRLDPLQGGRDLHQLVHANLFLKILAMISLCAFFIKALKLARHADVICSHWLLPSGLIGATLASLFRKPHVAIEHSGALHLLLRMRSGRALARFIVRRSRRIITVSQDLRSKLTGLCPYAREKTEVIPMGIAATGREHPPGLENADRLLDRGLNGQRGSENKILFIGRLIEIKGLEILLKALATLQEVQLLVAGDGEQRMALESLAAELKVNAVFLGQLGRAEKARLLATSTMVVIPSIRLPDGRTEGAPVVALEALAAGLPVIAAGVGGLSEIIIDGQNGLLFEAGNHLLLADRIQRLLDDRELRERLSSQARRTAEAFDWQIVGAKFSEIFKDYVSTNGSVESYQAAQDCRL